MFLIPAAFASVSALYAPQPRKLHSMPSSCVMRAASTMYSVPCKGRYAPWYRTLKGSPGFAAGSSATGLNTFSSVPVSKTRSFSLGTSRYSAQKSTWQLVSQQTRSGAAIIFFSLARSFLARGSSAFHLSCSRTFLSQAEIIGSKITGIPRLCAQRQAARMSRWRATGTHTRSGFSRNCRPRKNASTSPSRGHSFTKKKSTSQPSLEKREIYTRLRE